MRHYWFPIFWAASIYFLCTLGAKDLPSVGFLWDILSMDKLIHAGMFAVLVLSSMVAFRKQTHYAFLIKNAGWVAVSVAAFYGIVIEFLQFAMAAGRSADLKDVAANVVGCILGVFFFRLVYGKALFNAS